MSNVALFLIGRNSGKPKKEENQLQFQSEKPQFLKILIISVKCI